MHPEPPPISEADEAALAALADGKLDPEREEALFARFTTEPALLEAYERQQRGLAAITAAAADVSAPLALRTRVAELERPAPRERRRLPRFRLALIPAAGLAAAVAIVVLMTSGGPTVDSMLAAATRPPLAAVTLDPGTPQLLKQQVDGVRFPDYRAKLGWRAEGTRTDTIRGRDTRTVSYTRDGRRVAYTIVGGEQLPWPQDAKGTTFRTFEKDGRTVVTWRRLGHTCVLSAEDVPEDTLLALAKWDGGGAVTF